MIFTLLPLPFSFLVTVIKIDDHDEGNEVCLLCMYDIITEISFLFCDLFIN